MAIKLPKTNRSQAEIRNELVHFIDPKRIDIEKTMVNLFMLLRLNGARARLKIKDKGSNLEIDHLIEEFKRLEKEKRSVIGAEEYPDAVRYWLRSNLTDMVNRGRETEKFSSLRPIHLLGYGIRNTKHARDYNSADQVYAMLHTDQQVKDDLKKFLLEGWDDTTRKVAASTKLDIDSLGILRLLEDRTDAIDDNSPPVFDKVRPLLAKEAEKFCEDIHALLQYRKEVPRHVLIEYIKTITAFHLSLYLLKLLRTLPGMAEKGTSEIDYDMNIVVDMTDNPDSLSSKLSMDDAQGFFDSIFDFLRAMFLINAALRFLQLKNDDSQNLAKVFQETSNPSERFRIYCQIEIERILQETKDEQDRKIVEDIMSQDDDSIRQYLEIALKARGKYHHGYHVQLLDAVMQKNTEFGMLAAGRSRKHRRRFAIGSRLLEALIQLCVLKFNDNKYKTEPVSIEEFLQWLHSRYGLIINGVEHQRFAGAGVEVHQAFRENMQAFTEKLRQIGFYSVLSDAFIMQKIRPRYNL